MNSKASTYLLNILLIFGSLIFCLFVFLLSEAVVRNYTDIAFLGNSSNLFITNAFGSSKGNAKNAEAMAFGVTVHTDENGFRIYDGATASNKDHDDAILILGDSVGFGPGVEADKTFAGLLAKNNDSIKVLNSSVIGYAARDYKNVVDYFLNTHKEIRKVILIFCLNDLSSASAAKIDLALKEDAAKVPSRHKDYVQSLKDISLLNSINDFLRTRSKLYILVKGLTTDPQRRYWQADYRLYSESDADTIERNLQPIADIANMLDEKGVSFSVIISPYEFQLRSNDDAVRLPQRILGGYFTEKGIDYIDAMPYFEKSMGRSKDFFLPFDPMHLSEKGHTTIYKAIKDLLI